MRPRPNAYIHVDTCYYTHVYIWCMSMVALNSTCYATMTVRRRREDRDEGKTTQHIPNSMCYSVTHKCADRGMGRTYIHATQAFVQQCDQVDVSCASIALRVCSMALQRRSRSHRQTHAPIYTTRGLKYVRSKSARAEKRFKVKRARSRTHRILQLPRETRDTLNNIRLYASDYLLKSIIFCAFNT